MPSSRIRPLATAVAAPLHPALSLASRLMLLMVTPLEYPSSVSSHICLGLPLLLAPFILPSITSSSTPPAQPHLNYCILVWGFNCVRLIKLQKKVLRYIGVTSYNAHCDPLFKTFKILKIPDLLRLQELKFYYKHTNNSGKVVTFQESFFFSPL